MLRTQWRDREVSRPLALLLIQSSPLWFCRSTNSQPAEVEPSTYDVVGGKSHGYDGKDEVYYSAVKAPPTSTGEGKGFTLSECPAYGPVSTPAPRGEKMKDQPVEYEVVQTTSS